MNERECETCIKRKSIYCPNSNKCFNTSDKPYYQNRIMLLEEKQELIDYLKEEMNNIELELVMKSQNDYELGKLQGYYKSCKEILSKIEKR